MRRVLLQLGGDGGGDRGQVGAVHLDVLGARGTLGDTGAAGLQRDRTLGLDDAEDVLGARLGGPLTGGLAGQRLVGAEVHQRAEVLVGVDAGVEADHRDAGVGGGLDRTGQRVRGDQGGGDRVDLGVDRVLDQGGLTGGGRVVGVLDGDAVVQGGGVDTGLDLVPEGVTRGLVGDDRDGVVLGAHVGTATGTPGGRRRRGRLGAAGAAAPRDRERDGCHGGGCDAQALPRSTELHCFPFVGFPGDIAGSRNAWCWWGCRGPRRRRRESAGRVRPCRGAPSEPGGACGAGTRSAGARGGTVRAARRAGYGCRAGEIITGGRTQRPGAGRGDEVAVTGADEVVQDDPRAEGGPGGSAVRATGGDPPAEQRLRDAGAVAGGDARIAGNTHGARPPPDPRAGASADRSKSGRRHIRCQAFVLTFLRRFMADARPRRSHHMVRRPCETLRARTGIERVTDHMSMPPLTPQTCPVM